MIFSNMGQHGKTMPLSTKLGLLVSAIAVVAFLFLFGFTFFLILLVGGVLTLLANLFGLKSKPGANIRVTRRMTFTRGPQQQHPRPPGPSHHPSRSSGSNYDKDDVIDV